MNNENTTINTDKSLERKVLTTSTELSKSSIPTTEFFSDLTTKVSYLKWITIGVSIVVALGFIINLFDIFNYRIEYFQKYQKKVDDLEKQNINFENYLKYNTITSQEKKEMEQTINNYLSCLKNKRYWQYEECFK